MFYNSRYFNIIYMYNNGDLSEIRKVPDFFKKLLFFGKNYLYPSVHKRIYINFAN